MPRWRLLVVRGIVEEMGGSMTNTWRIIALAAAFAATAVQALGEVDEQHDICIRKTPALNEQVIESCRKVLSHFVSQQFPGLHANAWNDLGNAYLATHQYADAIHAFSEGLREVKKFEDPAQGVKVMLLKNRATAFRMARQWPLALEDADTLVALQPIADHYALRCLTRAKWGQQLDRAMSDCSQALRLDPNPAVVRAHSFLAMQFRDFVTALADQDALVSQNNTAEALNGRCWVRAVWGKQLNLALADCNEALKQKPDEAHFLDSRALIYFRLGRYTDAINDCDRALAIAPWSAATAYVRGVAKLRTGDTAAANADIATAKGLDPGIAEEYAGYGISP